MANLELYEAINYRSEIPYIFSRFIREYDISKANISILYKKGVIDEPTYIRLCNVPKEIREREVGLMELHDKRIYRIIADGIIEAKKNLFESNNIQTGEVLAIRNDAVFIVNRALTNTEFDGIVFANKNTYSSFVSVKKIDVYYGVDKIRGTELIDVKGLGKSTHFHEEFMTDFIIYIINQMESGDIETAISSLKEFYKAYCNKQLDIGYYREYNSESKYKVLNVPYKISIATNDHLDFIDITYNRDVIRELYSYITSIYFTNNK